MTTVPASIGRYEIVRRLAIGGMAEIFLARATGLEDFRKLVVLKRILPQFAADESFVRMFLDEARLSARLQHPNIAQVFDMGRDGDQYFFAMEYVPGRSLQEVLQRAHEAGAPVELEPALAIVLGVCAGLHHAHEQRDDEGRPLGIVHRDVSPSNVLVAPDGAVKVVDFGIAKAASGSHVTRDAFVKGKVAYMSPEQCTGGAVDRRSDVFSIGVLLFELTTGTRLYAGESDWAILHQIADHDAPAPSTRKPGYPPALETIVKRALHRDPELRYGTALELQMDLENLAREARLSASPVEVGRLMTSLYGEELADEPRLLATTPAPAGAGATTRTSVTYRGRKLLVLGAALGAAAIGCAAAALAARERRAAVATYAEFHEAVKSGRRFTALGALSALGGAVAATASRRRRDRQ